MGWLRVPEKLEFLQTLTEERAASGRFFGRRLPALPEAQRLADSGCYAVCEGANMPTNAEATEVFLKRDILFIPGKASNAGGVATSALEMGQNSIRSSWTFDEVDAKLKGIMINIYYHMKEACEQFDAKDNFVVGANIAGFMKVADAMMAQGIV